MYFTIYEEGIRNLQGFLRNVGATETAQVVEQASDQASMTQKGQMQADALMMKIGGQKLFSDSPNLSSDMEKEDAAKKWFATLSTGNSTPEDREKFNAIRNEAFKGLTDMFFADFMAGHGNRMKRGEQIRQESAEIKAGVEPRANAAEGTASTANPQMPASSNIESPANTGKYKETRENIEQKGKDLQKMENLPMGRMLNDAKSLGKDAVQRAAPLTEDKVEKAKDAGQGWAEKQKSK